MSSHGTKKSRQNGPNAHDSNPEPRRTDIQGQNAPHADLRSNPVLVIREDSSVLPAPMHVANGSFELILLNCGVNAPWQFTYQFAHELTHLAARSDLRFGQSGRHAWIEEVLCGAGSIYALRCMAKEGGSHLEANARDYLLNHTTFDYSSAGVTKEWFATNSAQIFSSRSETATNCENCGSRRRRLS